MEMGNQTRQDLRIFRNTLRKKEPQVIQEMDSFMNVMHTQMNRANNSAINDRVISKI